MLSSIFLNLGNKTRSEFENILSLIFFYFEFVVPESLVLIQYAPTPYPITRRQILDSSKLKETADDNFKFDEHLRNLSKRVENTVGKGEIARYEQFLLFPQCFQKAFSQGHQKVSLCGNGLYTWPEFPPTYRVRLHLRLSVSHRTVHENRFRF